MSDSDHNGDENKINWIQRAIDKASETGRIIQASLLVNHHKSFVEFICPHCHNASTTKIKQFCESTAIFCEHCKGIPNSELNLKSRTERLNKALAKIIKVIPKSVIKSLADDCDVHCPDCNTKNLSSHLEANITRLLDAKGFFCTACAGSGKIITTNPGLRSSLSKHKAEIQTMIAAFGNKTTIEKAISIKKLNKSDSLYITLTCDKNHEITEPLAKMRNILAHKERENGGSPCPLCNPVTGKQRGPHKILELFHAHHPDGELIGPGDSTSNHIFHCGQKTQLGDVTINHPNVIMPTRLRSGVTPDPELSYCLICADEQNRKLGGTKKTTDQLLALMQFRTALFKHHTGLATEPSNISCQEVTDAGKTKFLISISYKDEVITIGPTGASNITGKQRPGFFSSLLKIAGVKTIHQIIQKSQNNN
jgi:predicted nucleic acid-binding Zn ribbon protein